MKVLCGRKKLTVVFGLLFAVIVGAATLTALSIDTYAFTCNYKLKYIAADSYSADQSLTVYFADGGEEQSVVLPDYVFYNYKPETYEGRILQAVIPDNTEGIRLAKLIQSATSTDLQEIAFNYLMRDVFEVHYYDSEKETLYLIYLDAPQALVQLIQSKTQSLSKNEMEQNEERLAFLSNFCKLKPEIYDFNNARKDYYEQNVSYGLFSLLTNDFNPEIPADCQPGMFDAYTDDDYFKNDKTKNIYNYQYGSNRYDPYTGKKATNDDIIQLVPIELFRSLGNYVYIGREYGFFIITHRNGPFFSARETLADVGIFNITYEDKETTNLGATIETVVEIEQLPVRQYCYKYKTQNDDWININENLTEVVMPSAIIFEPYYLHNISFGGMLFDEQKINYGDSLYNVNKDTSAYFNNVRLDYHCSSVENADKVEIGKAAVNMTMGLMSYLPFPVGTICSVASTVWGILENIIAIGDEFKINQKDYEMNNDIYMVLPQNSSNFTRAMGCALTAPPNTDKMAVLRENNFVKATYSVGNYNDNYVRMYNTFGVSVSQLNRGGFNARDLDFMCEGGSTYYRNIQNRQPPVKPIEVNDVKQISLLQKGIARFEFIPQCGGKFNLSGLTNKNLKIIIKNSANRELYQLSGGTAYDVVLNGNGSEKYIIDVSFQNPYDFGVLNFEIALQKLKEDIALDFSIEAGYSYGANFFPEKVQTYKISTGNSNMEMRIIRNGKDEKIFASGKSEQYFCFRPGFKYVIILKNTFSNKQNGTFLISECSALPLDTELPFITSNEFVFFSYTNTTSEAQNMLFSVNDMLGKSYLWDVRSAEGNILAGVTFSDVCALKITVQAGIKIFVGFQSHDTTDRDSFMKASFSENATKWIIDGKEIEGNELYLKRGASAEVGAKIGNAELRLYHYNNNVFTFSNNKITVRNDARIMDHYILVAEGVADFNLTVYALYEKEFDYSIKNGENIILSWVGLDEVKNINIKVTAPNGNTWENDIQNNYNLLNLERVLAYNGWNNFSVTLNYITVGGSNGNSSWTVDVYNNNQNLEVADKIYHPLFDGTNEGETENDPHLLSSVRHLDNIRRRITRYYNGYNYDQKIEGYYELTKDIFLTAWTPIPDFFHGTLDGNGKKIYNMTITIPSATVGQGNFKNYGFFETIYGGTIKNLTLGNATIYGDPMHESGYVYVGAFAGNVIEAELLNCSVENGNIQVHRKSSMTGGIVGSASFSYFDNCHNKATTVTANGEVGGIAGVIGFNTILTICTNAGPINYYLVEIRQEFNNAGGIVGRAVGNGTKIRSCRNFGTVSYTRPKMEKNESLAPCMGQIAGYIGEGAQYIATVSPASGKLDKGTLYTFKTGAWWWEKTFDQARNVKAEVGLFA